MRELHLEGEFPVSVETFFTFFFESPGFKQRYHTTRGDKEIEVRQWVPVGDGRYTREILFNSMISKHGVINSMVGDKTKVREVQTYQFKDGSILHVTSKTFFEGTKVGNSFKSESEWIVSPDNNNKSGVGCIVVINVQNNYNGIMLKGLIENWVHDTTEVSFNHWMNLVKAQIEEYEESERLKRVAPTPVKQSPKMSQHIVSIVGTGSGSGSLIDEDEEIADDIDENQSTVRSRENLEQKLQQQQPKITSANSLKPINNNEDDESDFSDLSANPLSINEDFTDEEDEEDLGSNEDQFFDSSEVWSQNAGGFNTNNNNNNDSQRKELKNFMVTINNDLNSIKSLIDVHHSRLIGLESAYTNLQSSRSLTTAPNNNSNKLNHINSNNLETPGNNGSGNLGGGVGAYISKLEEMIKHQQEEEGRLKDKQSEWEQKMVELERKVNSLGNSNRSNVWLNVIGLIIFLIGWPIVAKKLWKHLLPLLTTLIKK
eukprot:gene5288-6582_t